MGLGKIASTHAGIMADPNQGLRNSQLLRQFFITKQEGALAERRGSAAFLADIGSPMGIRFCSEGQDAEDRYKRRRGCRSASCRSIALR